MTDLPRIQVDRSGLPIAIRPLFFERVPRVAHVVRIKTLVVLELDKHRILEIPANIRCLGNLRSLSVVQCGLSKLPPELCCLKQLRILHVDSNNLDQLPEDLGRLENLDNFTASHNRLEDLPTSFAQLHRLSNLVLDENRLRFSCLPKLLELTSLDELSLSYNPLDGREYEVVLEIGRHLKKVRPFCVNQRRRAFNLSRNGDGELKCVMTEFVLG